MSAGFTHDDDLATDAGEENDPLWRLLGRAPLPPPDGWFTVRTLARCRHAGAPVEAWGRLSSRLWRWALGSGLGLCLCLFLAARLHPQPVVSPNQKGVQEAFEIMASLPNDPDSTSSSTWQDSSL